MDPFVIDFNGSVNKDVTFRFEDNTDVYAACSVLYREKWYVFGGNYQPRQVSSSLGPPRGPRLGHIIAFIIKGILYGPYIIWLIFS